MKVEIIAAPDVGALKVCGTAAALCTDSKNPQAALRGAMASGHESVLEHASFTFQISGISRVALAQLTRHRIASYSVLSQRYVTQSGRGHVVPESIQKRFLSAYERAVSFSMESYEAMIQAGVPKEDARYLLPQCITTDVIMTMNVRELRHFFSLRMCNRAQWEIRQMADEMLKELIREGCGELFKDAGPGCVRGHCPEGKRSCGHPRKPEEWEDD